MSVTQLESRKQGATRPSTVLTLTDDNSPIDTTIYTWTITGAPAQTRKVAWTKNTAITPGAGGLLTVVWAAADLGACTIPTNKQEQLWELELVGLAGGEPRIYTLLINITRRQTP